ncbi:hypothetical protein IRJ41_024663 [Triplophysa rosa]|uniref:Integrase catalytic domain-containing protein n=1 Tax=Triplophysa rosa TaxID=992332 RepID=A0A9W7WJQ0_TRIRA|nr:hypothetical protein IRJ41_024663 [Triplophysa rosa]
MQRLNLSGRRTLFLLQTMGQEKVVPAYVLSGLEVSSVDGNIFYQLPQMLTQKQMPVSPNIIVSKGDLSKWPYLAKVEVPHIMANVDLLIGSNAPKMLEPWEVINNQGNGPYAIRTALGWVINGSLHASSLEAEDCSAVVNRIYVCRLEEMLSIQYNHDFNEQAAEEQELSREDIRFLEIAESSATFEDNHYTLKLPFKKENVYLPNNFSVAKQRMLGLKRRFQRDEQFYQEYVTFVNDMINKGYAEQVPIQQMKRNLRVVFDCGAVFKGTSLNQVLLQGPNLTNTLLGVLLRFRQELVAVMGDIQAMFHQVRVAEEDQDFLHFLWWQNGDFTKEMSVFRMTVHLFGAVFSPSCAAFALRKTADDHQSEFREEVVKTLKENVYVDDCLKSVVSEEEAVCLVKDLSMLCQQGGFTLTKWISNKRTVLQTFPKEYRAKEWKDLDLDKDSLPVERALGLLWCAETDSFKCKIEIQENSCTRRGMLSVSSSVYDPLGFLAPVVLPAKIMLQELCRRKLGWDENVPNDIARHWVQWLKELNVLSEFKVKRCIKPGSCGFYRHAQLHHFSDASLQGYGTVTYLRIENSNGDIYVAFLMGKARVTPLKAVTIPRLELTAALLAVRVDLMLKKELRLQLQESVFWTDSTSVLRYVMNEDKRFYTFVANRVSIIREVTKTAQWRYVSSKENPADDASRGRRAGDFIKNNLWIEGPKFLWKPQEVWSKNIVLTAVGVDDPKVKKEVVVNVLNTQGSLNGTSRLMAYFANWRKLQVAVAWFLKLKRMLLRRIRKKRELDTADTNKQNALVQANCRVENTTGGQTLSAEDLMEAELAIICYCQQQRFPEEIAAMSSRKDLVSKQSVIYRLDPWLDNVFLRVGGRLARASLPEDTKYPLLLSKDQHVATLILKDLHEQLGHSGHNHMLSTLRRRYWITGATSAVRKIIAECCFCKKYNGRRMEQKMADLPKERILPDHPPSTNTGVDNFGPIEVKKGRGTVKRYGVIFTCLASRAVHLELANSLDTDACINALRRFISRRGQVEHLLSDNGTNFIGAETELKEALSKLNQTKIQEVLCQKGIKWSFNPPAGSHFGGVWERLIRMLWKILTAVLQQQKLDDDGLHTVLSSPNPNHILLLKGKPCLSPGLFEEHDLYIKRRWKQVQYISDLFWKRWVKEYLPLLQERQKWNTNKNSLRPGDIVSCKHSLIKKGLVRFVRLQTKTSVMDRPVAKLCLLHESVG